MMESLLGRLPLDILQSSGELGLLDDIDRLRSQGISHYISLPQLIVCGDQSSGKSSVLEAISGIPFPTKDNLCTRFATEVILRRSPSASISVAIVPSQTRSESECEALSDFKETLTDISDFPALVEKAKEAMGLTSATSAFSNDVLRVEMTGPDRPHLTIVDLPGLIHSENKLQSTADVKLVQDMVRYHMSNKRSIILAIVSAKNDYANQIVLKLAKEVDRRGLRTLGIITKPDTLPIGSESEKAFVTLANNQDVEFRLGWHVLRNRDYEMRNSTAEARDLAESQFFLQGVWSGFPRSQVGIATLRQRLSRVLLEQIKLELPSLVEEIEANVSNCRAALEKLGASRAKPDEQRLFLLKLSQAFQSLVGAATDGTYSDVFFGDPWSAEGYSKRLRAVIQDLNLNFADTMRTRGHQRQIVGEAKTDSRSEYQRPQLITRANFLKHVNELLKRSRGKELPGMFNPLIVGDLFHEQSQPWEKLAEEHIEAVWEAVRYFLELTMSHLTDETTLEAVLGDMILPSLEEKLRQMRCKLGELLRPYQRGHPITYNHYFTETVQNIREKRMQGEIAHRLQRFLGLKENATLEELNFQKVKKSSLVSALAARNEADMDRFACAEALDCMDAFYKVAMKSLVDNVAIHAVESILVSSLGDTMSPARVMRMTSEQVGNVAAESEENRAQREQLRRRLAILEAGLETCKRYAVRKSTGALQKSPRHARELDFSPVKEEPEDVSLQPMSGEVNGVPPSPSPQPEDSYLAEPFRVDHGLQTAVEITEAPEAFADVIFTRPGEPSPPMWSESAPLTNTAKSVKKKKKGATVPLAERWD